MIGRIGRENWERQEVAGFGPTPCRILVVGERPGLSEVQQGRPFVGPTGEAQRRYFALGGIDVDNIYLTNLVKSYSSTNADPTADEIRKYAPALRAEMAQVAPRLIFTVGRLSARHFLGDSADMRVIHGIPHASPLAPAATVIPLYHPAWGMHDPEARPIISYDYARACAAINAATPPVPVVDRHAGQESYRDVTGREMADAIKNWDMNAPMGLDTEGYPDAPWSIQVSAWAGTGLVLRYTQPDFATGIAAIRRHVLSDRRPVVPIHNAMYDIEMCAAMGLDLFDANLWDSMYAAYLTRVEPRGLKALAYRWCGMAMTSYEETVGDAAREKQLDYLSAAIALSYSWPKPDTRVINNNDGTSRPYTPARIATVATKILADCVDGKVNKDGEVADPVKRWKQTDVEQRTKIEAALGPIPRASLADIPLSAAVRYSGRDPDATLRLYHALSAETARLGLSQLQRRGMDVLPVFEEMQRNGMPASRSYFVKLHAELDAKMRRLQSRISHRYYDDAPFNPASPLDVEALMKRQKVKGEKWNRKTRRMSTAKKSIEHLRHTNAAMGDVIEWREMQKNRDSFCQPIINKIPVDGPDIAPVRCEIKTTTVATRRISASNPNLTAMPARNEEGVRIRNGFVAPDGEVFGSWDLSQVEMRYMAHLSEDPLLIRFFKEGRDVHAETAARIFGIPLAKVDEMAHRYPAKRAGFGIITNISGSGLYDQLRMFGCKGWSVRKCDELVDNWLGVYTGVAQFLADCKEEAHATGVVYDCWGMPRYLPGVWSDDAKTAAEDERAASSHKIQGGAQGMIQNSMVYLKSQIRDMQQAGLNVKWRLQIHDEVILSFSEDLWEPLNEIVVEALTKHHGLENPRVPIKAKGSYAKTWGALKA